MDSNHHHHPMLSMVISFLSTIWAFISINEVQPYMALAASCIAILSGFFAARYYYYATKEKKESLNKSKSKLKKL